MKSTWILVALIQWAWSKTLFLWNLCHVFWWVRVVRSRQESYGTIGLDWVDVFQSYGSLFIFTLSNKLKVWLYPFWYVLREKHLFSDVRWLTSSHPVHNLEKQSCGNFFYRLLFNSLYLLLEVWGRTVPCTMGYRLIEDSALLGFTIPIPTYLKPLIMLRYFFVY